MLLLALALQATAAPLPEAPTPPRVRSVALFKNGLAWVRGDVRIEGAGPLWVGAPPDAVHGTLRFDADVPIAARATEVEVEVPFDGRWETDPQRLLAGAQVVIRVEGLDFVVSGTVVAPPEPPEEEWRTDYDRPDHWYGWWGRSAPRGNFVQPPRFLAVDTGSTTYVRLEDIRTLVVTAPPAPRQVRRPALELGAPGADGPLDVNVSYLTKGLSYAPSYRVELDEDGALELVQSAVVRNELFDLEGVQVELVTGFPNTPLSHVLTPLASSQTWAGFFEQLGRRAGEAAQVMSQMLSNSVAPGGARGTAPAGEPAEQGIDLHHQPLGPLTLAEGESLQVDVASGEAPYEQVVHWQVPDQRDRWGRVIQSRRNDDGSEDELWDALIFDNPLPFPMTTAPATVTARGRFLGERTVEWTAAGGEVVLPVTRALAVSCAVVETEVEGSRQVLSQWRESVDVNGALTVRNDRATAVKVIVRRRVPGEVLEVSGEPEQRLVSPVRSSLRARRELTWTLELAAGEERELTCLYRVLVRR